MNLELDTNYLNSFLTVYFHKIEMLLNNTLSGLETIKFQSEEANTDEFIKRFFQDFLLKNNHISDVNLKFLSVKIDAENYIFEIEKLKNYHITKVLLPEQLDSEQKRRIANAKKSVYTNPDLYLEITNGTELYYESLELKSTKDNNIPGSSVQQVSPFEWVIFVKRDNNKISVTTGYYINSITEKLPFPDRSPRPQIGFKTLLDWNNRYRKVEKDTLIIENISNINNDKIKLLSDWQDYLATEWLDIIKATQINRGEKWFNNAIRKFALKFLDYTETLSENDKKELKDSLSKLIK
jgi:hypothetical protein